LKIQFVRPQIAIVLLALVSPCAADPAPASADAGESALRKFDVKALDKAPEVFPTDDFAAEGARAFFYEGMPYRGKPTRVFAYYGVPKGPPGAKFPAMVLIHGGGGTAFDRWVRVWTARGYAAIAMDLCGCVPDGTYGNWKRHAQGGPPGWDASFGQIDEPIEDHWQYHSVSVALRAHSLLRSFHEVDADKIGVTGISWGGYLTCLVAGVDQRFKFAAPVYGCGYLGDNSVWLPAFEKMGPERASRWLNLWDPSRYLPHTKMPMLWVNGTNDFAYPLDSYQKILRFIRSTRTNTGLSVSAYLDRRKYLTGLTPTAEQLANLRLKPAEILPKWNYTIRPHTVMSGKTDK
jgi:dienelactone hydrolase